MTGLEIWLLAVGLAMDCFAVSIASGIILKRVRLRPMLVMAVSFGFFQALMPLLGWIGASFFSHLIESIDHWIAFGILAFLGGRMIMESFKDEGCKHEYDPTSLKVVLALAVATSIDALAVGVSFAFLGIKQFSAILSHIGFFCFVFFVLFFFFFPHRDYRFCIIRLVDGRPDVRHPFRMWHSPQTARRTLGRDYPRYHRYQDIDRASLLLIKK